MLHKLITHDPLVTAPAKLLHGDVIAIATSAEDGDTTYCYKRVVLKDDGKATKLGFPKRMTADSEARFADYVANGEVVVVGRVEDYAPKAKKPSPAKSRKGGKVGVDSKNDALDKRIQSRRAQPSEVGKAITQKAQEASTKPVRMTKASAADALDAMAAALSTLASALR